MSEYFCCGSQNYASFDFDGERPTIGKADCIILQQRLRTVMACNDVCGNTRNDIALVTQGHWILLIIQMILDTTLPNQ